HCVTTEKAHGSVRILNSAPRRNSVLLLTETREFPVRRPLSAVTHANREPAGPAREPRELPSADDSVYDAMCIWCKPSASAVRKSPDPVRVDLMRQIEVRRSAERLRIPRIDDLAAEGAALRRDAARIRRNVDRLRIGVVEVKLNTVPHVLLQA